MTAKRDGENPNPERPAPDTKPGAQAAEAHQAGSDSGEGAAVGGGGGDERAFGAKPGDLGPVAGDTEASKERSDMTQKGGKPAGEGETLNQGMGQSEDEKTERARRAAGPQAQSSSPATDPNHPESGEGDIELSFPADQLGGVDWDEVAAAIGEFHVGGDSTNEGGRRVIRFAPGAPDE